uniref:ATP synthase F0 subunit 8 n=1 Tax=Syntypistis chambae TaxID=1973588 RepID=UPI001FAFC2B9|nr:ATP synthase F0 subunit 8 [Syntypistis chambae]UNP54473.1 ATP synthase F0 subunit 8 [Syntypistis chambae]
MPQMMPINWFISLFFFILIIIMFNMMNYYIFLYKFNVKNNLNKFNNMKNYHWKW